MKCPQCEKLHRELPDFLAPFKQYAVEIISGVLDGIVTSGDEDSSDYPCEETMSHCGNYLCIPNWGIGIELSFLSDRFWNTERLRTEYPELSSPDEISIVNALAMLGQHIKL